jgi:hypothetical protein
VTSNFFDFRSVIPKQSTACSLQSFRGRNVMNDHSSPARSSIAISTDPEDTAREERIKRFGESMLAAVRPSDAMLFWELMRAEIARRSPAQVARMETSKGLK